MAQNSCSSSYHHNGIPAGGKREGEVDGRPLPFKGMALKRAYHFCSCRAAKNLAIFNCKGAWEKWSLSNHVLT